MKIANWWLFVGSLVILSGCVTNHTEDFSGYTTTAQQFKTTPEFDRSQLKEAYPIPEVTRNNDANQIEPRPPRD